MMNIFKHHQRFQFWLSCLMMLFLLTFSSISQSATPANPPAAAPVKQAVAQVVWVKGEVKAIAGDKTTRILERRGVIYAHDTLVTSGDSSGQIVFTDNTLVSISPKTEVNISDYKYTRGAAPSEDKYLVKVAKGGFRTISGAIAKSNPDNYKVNTPVATIGVRGTEWAVDIVGNQVNFKIETGSIVIQTPDSSASLAAGTDKLFATIDSRSPKPEIAVSATVPEGAFTTETPIVNATSTLPPTDDGSQTPAAGGAASGGSDAGSSGSGSDSGSSSSSSGTADEGASSSESGTSDAGASSSDSGSPSSEIGSSDSGSSADSGTLSDTGATSSSTTTTTPSATGGNGKTPNSFCIQ